ncbi:UNVERIFIED_CONTAM: hypothetical protein NCL1_11396 [Trichonephila clavipes]
MDVLSRREGRPWVGEVPSCSHVLHQVLVTALHESQVPEVARGEPAAYHRHHLIKCSQRAPSQNPLPSGKGFHYMHVPQIAWMWITLTFFLSISGSIHKMESKGFLLFLKM